MTSNNFTFSISRILSTGGNPADGTRTTSDFANLANLTRGDCRRDNHADCATKEQGAA